jgi:hypothetical protein
VSTYDEWKTTEREPYAEPPMTDEAGDAEDLRQQNLTKAILKIPSNRNEIKVDRSAHLDNPA